MACAVLMTIVSLCVSQDSLAWYFGHLIIWKKPRNLVIILFSCRTDFDGGTCFLKSGSATKTDAISTGNPGMVCGIPLARVWHFLLLNLWLAFFYLPSGIVQLSFMINKWHLILFCFLMMVSVSLKVTNPYCVTGFDIIQALHHTTARSLTSRSDAIICRLDLSRINSLTHSHLVVLILFYRRRFSKAWI